MAALALVSRVGRFDGLCSLIGGAMKAFLILGCEDLDSIPR